MSAPWVNTGANALVWWATAKFFVAVPNTVTSADRPIVPPTCCTTFNIAEAGSGPTFTTTMTTHLRLHGTDGSFITIREVAHLTVSAGDVRVAFDRPTFSCS